MREYYYLISSLPELELDTQKPTYTLKEFIDFCNEQLHEKDSKELGKAFLFNDLINIINQTKDNTSFIEPSFYNKETLEENFKDYSSFFSFIETFLENINNDKREKPELLAIDELITSMYINLDEITNNKFLKDYFLFELDLKNIANSISLKKLGLPFTNAFIPFGDAYERLSKSFPLDNGSIPRLESLVEALQGDNIIAAEKIMDEIRWQYLDEQVGSKYLLFDFIIAYAVKLQAVTRWQSLTDDKGKKVLDGLTDKIKSGIHSQKNF